MHALRVLTIANIRSFMRDRAALFWTLAFPIVFVLLFGTIFGGNGTSSLKMGWVDEDGTPASQQFRAVFAATQVFDLHAGVLQDELDARAAARTDTGQTSGEAVRGQTGGGSVETNR